MKLEEFREKIKQLFIEFDEDNEYTYILALFRDDGKIDTGGYGCQACAIEALNSLLENHQVSHNRKEEIH